MVQTNTLEKGLLAPLLRAVCLLPRNFKKGADLSRNGGIWARSRHRRCPQEAQCGRDSLGPGAGRAEGIQDTSPEASKAGSGMDMGGRGMRYQGQREPDSGVWETVGG